MYHTDLDPRVYFSLRYYYNSISMGLPFLINNVRCISNETQLSQCDFSTQAFSWCELPLIVKCLITEESKTSDWWCILANNHNINNDPLLIYWNPGTPGAPQNTKVLSTSLSTITLSWSPPLVSELLGLAVFNYIINCTTSLNSLSYAVMYTESQSATLSNLLPFTPYNCCVAVSSSHGRGKPACHSTVTWDKCKLK